MIKTKPLSLSRKVLNAIQNMIRLGIEKEILKKLLVKSKVLWSLIRLPKDSIQVSIYKERLKIVRN
jgi:hypothetical protein